MDEISILKARIATLEAQMAPKPKPAPKKEKLSGPGVKDPFGMHRDGRGKPIPREVDLTPPPNAREIELKAKFDQLTRGCFEPGSWQYETELDHYIEADGNYRPSLFRDPMGVIRNRDGVRASTAYPSGLTGVDLLSRPVPGHQFVDMGHFVICDAG